MKANLPIRILELRNYLLNPNTTDRFIDYFNKHFVEPMQTMGGYTMGEFKIKDVEDRFVWMRGFTDMMQRVRFLNDFYVNSDTWKSFGPEANEMMINSDNVYLLRPLLAGSQLHDSNEGINSDEFDNKNQITTVDFYIANTRLHELIELFNISYLPFLASKGITPSMWVSELSKNDFPRLPVFQDKNLLVLICFYKTESEYEQKTEMIRSEMTTELKRRLQEVVTIHDQLILLSTVNNI